MGNIEGSRSFDQERLVDERKFGNFMGKVGLVGVGLDVLAVTTDSSWVMEFGVAATVLGGLCFVASRFPTRNIDL